MKHITLPLRFDLFCGPIATSWGSAVDPVDAPVRHQE
jgi:hypothetical protein